MKHTTTITGPMMANGMRRIDAKSGTVVSTTSTATMLPRYMLAIRPQTKSGRSMNSMGPGIQAPDHQAAHHHRCRGRAGHAQRQHRQHGAAAGRVVGGLLARRRLPARPCRSGPCDGDRRLANAVAHEGRGGGPAGRDAHPAPDDAARAAGRPSSAAWWRSSRMTSRGRDPRADAVEAQALLHGEQSSPMPNRPMTAMRKLMPERSSLNP